MEDVKESTPFKVNVGALEVLTSGIVHVTDNNILKVFLNDIAISFNFISDTSIKGHEAKYDSPDGKELSVKLINFSNPLGTGMLLPAAVGNYDQRRLYVSFFVWSPNVKDGNRIVNYVFYLGEPV